ncbi:MAG: branched-chain amino acid ABC transporter permease, partial [Parvibaculaceae bacterium]
NAETLTGGPFGIGFIPRAFAGVEDRPLVFNLANLLLVGLLTAVLYYGLERLVRSPWGRVLRAIREDETAALSLGKNANLFRIQAFALGGAIMGLAGAVQAHFIGFIAPENYASTLTFQVWAMLIIGGSGNNLGALLGAVLVWGLWSVSGVVLASAVPAEYQARAAALQIVLIGVALAALLVVRPRGLIGEEKIVSRFLSR